MGTDFNLPYSRLICAIGCIVLFGLAPVTGQRPVEVIPMIIPPYPNEFHEFEEDFDSYTITVINYTFEEQQLYFHVGLVGDNGVSAQTNTDYRPADAFVLGARETYIMTGAELRELNRDFTESDFTYEGVSELQLAIGVLPEGNYELCVVAFDYQTGEQLSVGCSFSFPAGNGDVPRIIYPFEGEVLPETMESFPITWEAPTSDPIQAMDFQYVVKMVDLSLYGDEDIEDVFLDGGVAVTIEQLIEGMTSTIYNDEGDDPPLIFGHQYGIRVQVMDPLGQLTFENNGYSEIRTFYFGEEGAVVSDSSDVENPLADLPADCESRCNIPAVTNQEAVTDISGLPSLRIGHFTIDDYTLTPDATGWSGEGNIVLSFLNDIRIRVALAGVRINDQGEIFEGQVRGIQDEGDVAEFMEYVTFPVMDGQLQTMSEMIPADVSAQIGHYLRDVRLVAALATGGEVGLPIGFEEDIAGVQFTLGITDLLLTPSGAKVKLVAGTQLPMFEGDNWLMFVTDSLCLHPAGFGGEYQLSLGADLVLNNQQPNAFELMLSGTNQEGREPCSMEMDCEGIRAVHVQGVLKFARSVIVPEEEDGSIGEGKAEALFSFSWDHLQEEGDEAAEEESAAGVHWLASLQMDKFQIPRLNGWTFEVNEGWIDMSEISNPDDIVFPQQYPTTGLDFTGVYIESATIQPPSNMCKGSRPHALVEHLIIDPNLYGRLVVDSLLHLAEGDIGGWSWSIDQFLLEVYNNELIEARLEGEMHMPLLDTSSFLTYFAMIGQGETAEGETPGGDPYAYQFNVGLTDTVRFAFLVAEGAIYDDSVLDVVYAPDDDAEVAVHAVLHGILSIDTDQFLPENFPELPASLKLPEMEYAFDYHSATGFNPDGTYVSFASPNKFISGFPVNMDDFDVSVSTTTENEISFDFNVAVSFAEEEADLAASAQFSLVSNLTTLEIFQDFSGLGQAGEMFSAVRSFQLQRIDFDSILLDVQISELVLEGAIGFYNEPLEGGGRNKGVRGDINVMLPIGPNGINARLTAIFGNTGVPAETYSESFYSYWYVDGIVSFPVAIQFGTLPLGLYGIGGGVGYNIIQTAAPAIVDGRIEGASQYEPTYESFRLSLKVIMGTTPKPDAFNADLAFIAQFANGGLDMIGIEGDGYVMTPMNDRDDPQVYVGCDIYMYMPNATRPWSIEGGMDVAVNVGDGMLVGNMSPSEIPNQMISASFHVSESQFYFHMGAPDFDLSDDEDPRGSAMLNLDILQAQAKTYLMLGHGVPTSLPPLPLPIQEMLSQPEGELDGTTSASQAQSGFDASQVETASGLAHGTYVQLTSDIDAYLLYATLAVYLGYDMNITQRTTQCANTGDIIGINGWYAEGQAYAGIEGGLGIRIKLLGEQREIKLFELAAAIALFGGAPNPFYFGGQASVRYSVLNGLVEGSSSFSFSVGERCTPALDDPMAGIDFFEYIDPGQDERDVFVGAPMHVKLTLPVMQDIVIPQPVEDANGVIIDQVITRYRPELSWSLRRQQQNQIIPLQAPTWTDDDRREQLYLIPQATLAPNAWFELQLSVRAWDYQEGRYLRVDGQEWSQDTVVRFRTGQLPPDLYPYVTHTVPLPMERYYLQGESNNGLVYFTQAIDQSYYFPVNDHFGGALTYYIRLTNLEDQTEMEVPFTYHSNSVSGNHYIQFGMPDLESGRIYALQIIRKSSRLPGGPGGGRIERSLGSFQSGDGVATDLTIETEALIPPGEQLEPGEFLLYHSYFRTSEFHTLREKMTAADVASIQYAPGAHPLYGKKVQIHLTLEEPFETRDFQAFYPSVAYPYMRFLPRIRMLDLFNTNYHDQHAERRLLRYREYYEGTVQGYPFVLSWPETPEFEWTEPQMYRLPSHRVNTVLQPPLSDDEVAALWLASQGMAGAYSGMNRPGGTGARSGPGMSLGTSLSCTITYDTHFKVNKDRKAVLDWAASYLTTLAPVFPPRYYEALFQEQYPPFLNRYQNLLNDDLRLENYEGQYSIQFGRNIATVAEEEIINIFSLYALPFSTPGAGILTPAGINPWSQWNSSR